MIPRYSPTYSYLDLFVSLNKCYLDGSDNDLCSRLAVLYDVKYVFLFRQSRVALFALLKTLDCPGDVLLPAYNCIAVPEVVKLAGYHPVFVDIDNKSFNMTADTLQQAITAESKVVLVTHQFGIPSEVDEILQVARQNDLLVLEDAAAAIGAKYKGKIVGTFGDASIISFHNTKVISGGGGGALLTNNADLAQMIDSIMDGLINVQNSLGGFLHSVFWRAATHSWVYPILQLVHRAICGEAMFEVVAPNTHIPANFFAGMSSFSSALVSIQLDQLEQSLNRRRKIVQQYSNELSGCNFIELPIVSDECSPSWIQFPVMIGDKWEFYKYMQCYRIDLSWNFRYSCADSYNVYGFPNTQKAAKTVLGLPTYPSLSNKQISYICKVARGYKATFNYSQTRLL